MMWFGACSLDSGGPSGSASTNIRVFFSLIPFDEIFAVPSRAASSQHPRLGKTYVSLLIVRLKCLIVGQGRASRLRGFALDPDLMI